MNWIFLESYKSWSISLWDLNHFWLISDQFRISDQDETSAGFFWSCSEVSRVPTPSLMNLSASYESDYSLADGGLQHGALVMLHLPYFHVNPHDSLFWIQKPWSGCFRLLLFFNAWQFLIILMNIKLIQSRQVCVWRLTLICFDWMTRAVKGIVYSENEETLGDYRFFVHLRRRRLSQMSRFCVLQSSTAEIFHWCLLSLEWIKRPWVVRDKLSS